jgi:hypothetical protein
MPEELPEEITIQASREDAMKRKRLNLFKRLAKGQRGQSMVAYAVITAMFLGAGFVLTIRILPEMLDAYNNFIGSLYFGINCPIP